MISRLLLRTPSATPHLVGSTGGKVLVASWEYELRTQKDTLIYADHPVVKFCANVRI